MQHDQMNTLWQHPGTFKIHEDINYTQNKINTETVTVGGSSTIKSGYVCIFCDRIEHIIYIQHVLFLGLPKEAESS
jgi:hypothetical protein